MASKGSAEGDELVGQLPDGPEVGQVGDVGRDGALGVGDAELGHGPDRALLVAADDEHLGAEVEELAGGGPTDAGGGAGEQDALAGQGAGGGSSQSSSRRRAS